MLPVTLVIFVTSSPGLDFIVPNALLTLHFLFRCGRCKVHLRPMFEFWAAYHTVGLPLIALKSLEGHGAPQGHQKLRVRLGDNQELRVRFGDNQKLRVRDL